MPRASLVLVVSVVAMLAAGCSEPPSKEMHQAQGAIDAAKAAGAEQYASDELQSAVDALAQYEAAVAASDYRLALAHALDSRERAQSAAKAAVDARARARGDAERELAEAIAIVERARTRLKNPTVLKLPRRLLASAENVIAAQAASLQEARAALDEEDYEGVQKTAMEAAERIQAELEALDAAAAGPGRDRKR
jgi:hypothetical protein